MFKFSKEEGICLTTKINPSVDWSMRGEENTEVFVKLGTKIGIFQEILAVPEKKPYLNILQCVIITVMKLERLRNLLGVVL